MERLDQMDFLCTECAKSFATEIDLLIHQTRVHDNRSFSCEICHAISVGNTNHNNHMRAHKPKKKPKTLLNCEECNYETTYKQNLNRQNLKAHTEKKDGNESNSKSCPDCGKSFPQQRNLTRKFWRAMQGWWHMNKLMRSSPLKNNSSAMNALMHQVTRAIKRSQ